MGRNWRVDQMQSLAAQSWNDADEAEVFRGFADEDTAADYRRESEAHARREERRRHKAGRRGAWRWTCLECRRTFRSIAAAERASLEGCPGCGGSDIDMEPAS